MLKCLIFLIMNLYIPIVENIKNTERFKDCSHISPDNYSLHHIIVCVVFILSRS